ncbi:MAG: histidine kinase [Pseudomonas sp.]|nr:histidine kinase [Pseudomonas sp.]
MSEPAESSAKPMPDAFAATDALGARIAGEMGDRIRDMDWAATSLGPASAWPQALATLIEVMLGSSQPMFVVWGPERSLLYNDAYAHILASKHPAALGQPFLDVWSEIRADLIPIVEAAYHGNAVTMDDIKLIMHRKGFAEETHFTFSYTPVQGGHGQPGGFFCACVEITDQVLARRAQTQAENALRDLNETLEYEVQQRTQELKRLWNTSPDLLLVSDFAGRFLRVNPAWTTLLGYQPEELLGHHVTEFVVADDHAQTVHAYAVASEEVLPRLVNRYRHKNGSLRWISWVAAPAGEFTYSTGRDITLEREQAEALRQAEEALHQAQKLEAIGKLTGGVAHDFNNLLTVIKSSADMLKRPNLPEARRSNYIRAISDTVDRAAKVTSQLLAFARRQALKPEVFAACDSVRLMSGMIEALTGSMIEVVTDLPEEPCFIKADSSQFDTALVNMAVNARDAMDGRGKLTIRVTTADRTRGVSGDMSEAQSFVAVSISDTGSGIPEEHLEHIFEPFFTTKRVGQGTGLGLSQVFGFAKQSGGEVTVDSAVGRGSTFTLYLPRADYPAQPTVDKKPESSAEGHGLCVLVVEDNAEIGSFTVQSLTDLGYAPVFASHAEGALAELAKDAGRFDVVFSDVVMPGMSGIDLACQVREAHPDLPILLTSGYSHVLAQNGTGEFELLHKPYSIEELSRLLRKAVSASRAR